MKIGIATCEKLPDLYESDKALIPLFAERNIEAVPVIWNDPSVNWLQFDFVVIRTTWDYFQHQAAFTAWLNYLETNGIKLFNPVSVVRKNSHKFYLKELQEKGIEIIPTVFIDKTNRLDLSIVQTNNWEQAVLKPAVSAGSYMTRLFKAEEFKAVETEFKSIAENTDLLLQPFMPEINTFGELSLIFFNRKFSHSVLKVPQKGDFRVQWQYGGKYQAFSPDSSIIETAENIISHVKEEELLYARIDGVIKNDRFLLMEMELIEPDLYFDHHASAKKTFVDSVAELAFNKVFEKKTS